jgi:hypothetical protein
MLVSTLTFMAGLLLTEAPGEMALVVDLKPFFIPYLLIAAARYGLPTYSIGISAAVGEGILDIFEGYELDDPLGFLGYVAGFIVFGWFLNRHADDPSEVTHLTTAAILGALVQAFFEGSPSTSSTPVRQRKGRHYASSAIRSLTGFSSA